MGNTASLSLSSHREHDSAGKFEKEWRARFEKFGRQGSDDASIAGWSCTGLDARLRNFRRVWAGDRPGTLWLDVGCGAGTYSRLLAAHELQVICMDYSLPTLVKARDRSPSVREWCVADVTRLPVNPGAFDGVLCFGVTQALADSAPAVKALCDAARPGGQVWIDALNGWCLPNAAQRFICWMQGRATRLRYESPRRLRSLMAQQGGIDVTLHWVPILPERWQRFQGVVEHPVAARLLRAVPGLGALLSHAFVVSARRGAARKEGT